MARDQDVTPQQLDVHEANKTTTLSLLNYNLYCLPWVATLFAPKACPLPAERAHHFLKHIQDYDILALQEVWNPRFRNIEKYATRHNYYVAGSSTPSAERYLKLRVFGGGLMIISKYPIVETKEILYDQGTGVDMFVTKGVLYAKIELSSNSFLHVFNTHLQASYGYEWDNSNPYALIRKKQLKKISDFIHDVTQHDQHPIVLMGDFNVNAFNAPGDTTDSIEYKDMMDILQGGKESEGHTPRFHVIDVLKVLNQDVHPVTHAGISVHASDKKADKGAHGGQRLDFIMDVRRRAHPHAHPHYPPRHTHRFVKGSVVPFQVSDKIFTHISDHFGAHTILEIPHTASAPSLPSPRTFVPTSPDLFVTSSGKNKEKEAHSKKKKKRGAAKAGHEEKHSLAQVSITLQASG